MFFNIHRETATQEVDETGELFAWYRPVQDDWQVSLDSKGDASGVDFTITAAGQLQYTSDDLTGAVYLGNLRISNIVRLPLSGADIEQAIINLQVGALDITGAVFDKTVVRAVRLFFNIHRETTLSEVDETGEIFMWHRPVQDDWQVSLDSKGDASGVDFSATAAGQLQYVSDDLAGASYLGELKIADIVKILV